MELRRRKKSITYYFENLSTIPDVKSYKVINVSDNAFVANLDEEFVALNCEPGANFVVKGEVWRVLEVQDDKVFVEPSEETEAVIPAWEGELIPVSFEVAQEVGKLRRLIYEKLSEKESKEEIVGWLTELYPIDVACGKKMVEIIRKQARSSGIIPDDETVVIEKGEGVLVVHACFGNLVNETLGGLLAHFLSQKLGSSVGLRIDAYRIILSTNFDVPPSLIKEILLKLDPKSMEGYLEVALPKTRLFEYKFLQVAKRFGVISKDAELGKVSLRRIIQEFVGTPVFKETLNEIKVEKLDVENTKRVLEGIREGRIKLVETEGLSFLSEVGLRKWLSFEGVSIATRPKEVLRMFKERILKTRVKLVCLNCCDWEQTFTIESMPEDVACKKCGARLLAVTNPDDTQALKVAKKKARNLPLKVEEARKYQRLLSTAEIFLSYRKKGVVALAGRGVGPKTALRILSKYYPTEEEFFEEIMRAEKRYQLTKRFWKV